MSESLSSASGLLSFPPRHSQWARASSFTSFLDHTQRRTTVGRTPLDEWLARRRDLYLTTHTTLTTNKRLCPRWDSNPKSQQASINGKACDIFSAVLIFPCLSSLRYLKISSLKLISHKAFPGPYSLWKSSVGFRKIQGVSKRALQLWKLIEIYTEDIHKVLNCQNVAKHTEFYLE